MDKCDKCDSVLDEDRRWTIAIETQKCIWGSPTSLPEVDIQFADGLGIYCSEQHANEKIAEYLLLAGAKATWADVRPIELCACCGTDFDTTDWHKVLTLIEENADFKPRSVKYAARFCQACVP